MSEKQERFWPPITENIPGTKFADGNPADGKHYWLTPPELMEELQAEFDFDFDPCPCPKPDDFDGLTCDWGKSNYVNPPFGAVMHDGKKKGPTAWARKCIEESKKGKRVVMVYPIDKWVLMMLEEGAKVRNLGDVKWCATEDGTPGKGTGRHVACFILDTTEAQITGDPCKEDLEGFCWNSRRWITFMVANPQSCPFGTNGWEHCGPGCGYYEERKPTITFKEKAKLFNRETGG